MNPYIMLYDLIVSNPAVAPAPTPVDAHRPGN